MLRLGSYSMSESGRFLWESKQWFHRPCKVQSRGCRMWLWCLLLGSLIQQLPVAQPLLGKLKMSVWLLETEGMSPASSLLCIHSTCVPLETLPLPLETPVHIPGHLDMQKEINTLFYLPSSSASPRSATIRKRTYSYSITSRETQDVRILW